jgi:hypothetical protein
MKLQNRAIVNLSGGLGNQLFQYAYACWLKHSFNIKPKLNLSRIDKNHSASSIDLRTLIETDSELEFISSNQPRLLLHAANHIDDFLEINVRVRLRNFIQPRSLRFREYYQSFRFYNQLKLSFSLKEPVNPSIFFLDAISKVSNRNSCTMHIRLGDLLKSDFPTILSREYYLEVLKSPSLKDVQQIIIVTDSPELIKSFLGNDFFPNFEVCVPRTSSPIESFHLLKQSANLIVANSTFSLWAAKLGYSPTKQIFYPSLFGSQHLSSSMDLPLEWTSIRSLWLSSIEIRSLFC